MPGCAAAVRPWRKGKRTEDVIENKGVGKITCESRFGFQATGYVQGRMTGAGLSMATQSPAACRVWSQTVSSALFSESMKKRPCHLFAWLLVALAISPTPSHAQHPALTPFTINHEARVDSPADVRFLLDAPAGMDGFIRVVDGHLATASGHRIRLWGVNITGWLKDSSCCHPGRRPGYTPPNSRGWASTVSGFSFLISRRKTGSPVCSKTIAMIRALW